MFIDSNSEREHRQCGSQPTVDVLIGLDCADLHFSIKDICGAPGKSVARLTPLGWTCIGAMDDNKKTKLSNKHYQTTTLLSVHTTTLLYILLHYCTY